VQAGPDGTATDGRHTRDGALLHGLDDAARDRLPRGRLTVTAKDVGIEVYAAGPDDGADEPRERSAARRARRAPIYLSIDGQCLRRMRHERHQETTAEEEMSAAQT
jgi:hypothetical protein